MQRHPWTAVALSEDILAGTAAPVILDDAEIVVWRSGSGSIQAWDDRCPHRGMRLSFGFVRGERLACLYHGWQYDTDAGCTAIPAHPDLTPPRTICANAYGCVEAGGFVFVRPGPEGVPAPSLGPATPVRSLTIIEALQTLAARLGVDPGMPIHRIDGPAGTALLVALHPMDATRTTIHVAVEGEADIPMRHAAVDWSEDLRRTAEGTVPLPDVA